MVQPDQGVACTVGSQDEGGESSGQQPAHSDYEIMAKLGPGMRFSMVSIPAFHHNKKQSLSSARIAAEHDTHNKTHHLPPPTDQQVAGHTGVDLQMKLATMCTLPSYLCLPIGADNSVAHGHQWSV